MPAATGDDGDDGLAPSGGSVSLPGRPGTPLSAVVRRMLLAVGLLVLSALLVYLGRDGYRDSAHPGRPVSLLASVQRHRGLVDDRVRGHRAGQ